MRSPDTLGRRRSVTVLVAGGAAIIVTMAILVVAVVQDGRSSEASTPPPAPITAASWPTPSPTTAGEPTATGAEVDRLAAAPTVAPSTHDRISGQEASQPDLYASAFVRRLLTQQYRQHRSELLGWVQAESVVTTEPLVVGLVPDRLRPRMATFSVTDPSTGDALVPTDAAWGSLAEQQAHTTVTIQRVVEPLVWSAAVEAGRITDPGITGRMVLATVTRHTGSASREFSVAVALNIEGPPTQDAWRFVTIVSVRSVPSLSS